MRRSWFIRGHMENKIKRGPGRPPGLANRTNMNAFARWMEASNITADRLAFTISVTPAAVRRWRRGDTRPRARDMAKIEILSNGVVTLQSWLK